MKKIDLVPNKFHHADNKPASKEEVKKLLVKAEDHLDKTSATIDKRNMLFFGIKNGLEAMPHGARYAAKILVQPAVFEAKLQRHRHHKAIQNVEKLQMTVTTADFDAGRAPKEDRPDQKDPDPEA